MQDSINETKTIEAIIILLTFSIGYIISRKDRKHYFLIYSTVLDLVHEIIEADSGDFNRPVGFASIERLEL